jgi:hypothetical protein
MLLIYTLWHGKWNSIANLCVDFHVEYVYHADIDVIL